MGRILAILSIFILGFIGFAEHGWGQSCGLEPVIAQDASAEDITQWEQDTRIWAACMSNARAVVVEEQKRTVTTSYGGAGGNDPGANCFSGCVARGKSENACLGECAGAYPNPRPTGTGSRGTASTPEQQAAEELCNKAINAAGKACMGMQKEMLLMQGAVVALAAAQNQPSNVAQLCGASAEVLGASAAMNAYMGYECNNKASKCKSTCHTVDRGDDCSQFDYQTFRLSQSASTQTASAIQAASCKKAAQNAPQPVDCSTADKQRAEPTCPMYCALNNWTPDLCKTTNCNNPIYATLDSCFCAIEANKTNTRCKVTIPPWNGTTPIPTTPTTPRTGGIPGGTINPNGLGDGLGDNIETGQGGYGGNPPGGGGGSNNGEIPQGGGGPGGLGGGSALGGGSGGGGAGPHNTDIDKGVGGAAGGGAGAGAAGGYGGGGGNQAGAPGGYGAGEPKFDWKSFLPGGKKAGRTPSGVSPELFNSGITAANGLTNFEKVTRKMNEKRTSLEP